MGIDFLRRKQDKVFLVLDIGTEAVKALFVKKDKDKNLVLGASIQYFEKFGVFDGKDFSKDITQKAILRGIEEVYELSVNLKRLPVLLGLSPNILKARVVCQLFEREEPEKKISGREQKHIYQQVLEAAKKKVSQDFANRFGILPSEILWINLKILAIKIDGYSVSELSGYEARNLDFKILATFLPKYYSENIKNIFKDLGLKISQIVHIAENLSHLVKAKETNGIFLDIGGDISQIFLVKKGELEEIFDFPCGGRAFSQELAEKLGLSEDSARTLKEKYSNGLLTVETNQRIREIFLSAKTLWYNSLKSQISPTATFLFGGGSLIPEIPEVLKDNGIRPEFISPKDFENIKDLTGRLKNPQYTPSLLII